MSHRASLPLVFRGGIRRKRRPGLVVEYHWALAGMYGSSPDSGLMFQYADEKRAGTTVRFVIWADRERTADLAISHVAMYQLRYVHRADQGECLNDDKPGLQDGSACRGSSEALENVLQIDDIAGTRG